jgi:hypothetical protein
LIPEESKGQDNVTITAKEVGKQALTEFMRFDTGIFNILVTKDTKPGTNKLELKASDTFGLLLVHSMLSLCLEIRSYQGRLDIYQD